MKGGRQMGSSELSPVRPASWKASGFVQEADLAPA